MADDAVQPADAGESQGDATATDSGLYDLDSVAPDVRELLEPHIKAINGNVEKKFRESADYKKQWTPYEELGLTDVPPDEVQGLLEFAKLANDPEQFNQWLTEQGQARGLFDQHQENDDLDLDSLEDESSPEKIEERITQKLTEELSPFKEFMEQVQAEQQRSKAETVVESAFGKAKEQFPEVFAGESKEQEEATQFIVDIASGRVDDESSPQDVDEAVLGATQAYLKAVGMGEKGLFKNKAEQPPTPEGPGAASTSPEKSTSFGDPRLKASAIEIMKNSA